MSDENINTFARQDKRRYVCFNCKHLVIAIFPKDKEERPKIRCPKAIFGVQKSIFSSNSNEEPLKQGRAVEYCKYQETKSKK